MQFIVSEVFKFDNNQYPEYFDKLFCSVVAENGVITCLKLPFRKTKLGIQSLSYVVYIYIYIYNYGSTQTYTKLKIYNHQTLKYSKGIWEWKEN